MLVLFPDWLQHTPGFSVLFESKEFTLATYSIYYVFAVIFAKRIQFFLQVSVASCHSQVRQSCDSRLKIRIICITLIKYVMILKLSQTQGQIIHVVFSLQIDTSNTLQKVKISFPCGSTTFYYIYSENLRQ